MRLILGYALALLMIAMGIVAVVFSASAQDPNEPRPGCIPTQLDILDITLLRQQLARGE